MDALHRAALSLTVVATLIAAACGSLDGIDPYALWRTYQDPGHAYHFHYPSPPWNRADDAAFGLPVYEVDADPDPLAELPAARLRLEARMYVPADLDEVIAAETAGWHELGYLTAPLEDFLSVGGDEGLLLEAWSEEVWVRQVFHEERGTVVTMIVWGTGELDEADLELLLASFEPRGAGGS